ncbi:hypothetical protein [Scytonema sp. PRP1]
MNPSVETYHVSPALQEGFPTAGDWRSPSGVPKAYPKGYVSTSV